MLSSFEYTVLLKDLLEDVSSLTITITAHDQTQLSHVWYCHIQCYLAPKESSFQNLLDPVLRQPLVQKNR